MDGGADLAVDRLDLDFGLAVLAARGDAGSWGADDRLTAVRRFAIPRLTANTPFTFSRMLHMIPLGSHDFTYLRTAW